MGWNFSNASLVYGVEAETNVLMQKGGISYESEDTSEIDTSDDFMSFRSKHSLGLRGRVGMRDDDVLLYGTAGLSYLNGEIYSDGDGGTPPQGVNFFGVSLGVGLEWAPSASTRLRTEILYTHYDDTIEDGPHIDDETEDSFTLEETVEFRIGLNWDLGTSPKLAKSAKPTHDWSGFYAGLHTGAGQLNSTGHWDPNDSDSMVDMGAAAGAGPIVGASLGWNFQNGSMVYGLMADISKPNWNQELREADDPSAEVEAQFDTFATIRGRVGFTHGDVLIFGSAGLAFVEGGLSDPDGDVFNNGSDSETYAPFDATLPVVGIGMEWAKSDRMSVVIEGLALIGSDETDLTYLPDGDSEDAIGFEGGIIGRIGVNFNF